MIYGNLFARSGDMPVTAGLIGTGAYGISLLAQTQFIPRLRIPVICDRDLKIARDACVSAGIPEDAIVFNDGHDDLLHAIKQGKCAVVEDYSQLMNLPLDVIVECTGDPESGARHAELAIRSGKHVAMVTKETDSVIGPLLHQLAIEYRVIYTPVDGDQHGLLIGLVSWARNLGLEVVCGGKARPSDFIIDKDTATVSNQNRSVSLVENEITTIVKTHSDDTTRMIEARKALLQDLPQIAAPDLCESVVAANATGLLPDTPALHAPLVRTVEIPEVLCLKEEGGILNRKGAIEVITCLRRADEAGLGGGVFIVISCKNGQSWKFLKAKGLLTNRRETCGVIYRPYHLLGVETPISVLCAGLLEISTGSLSYEPQVDLVAKTKRNLKAGETIKIDHGSKGDLIEPLILSCSSVKNGNPIPFYMAAGNRVKKDVSAGTVLTCAMIEEPVDARLWELRREQDKTFGLGK